MIYIEIILMLLNLMKHDLDDKTNYTDRMIYAIATAEEGREWMN